MTFWLLTRPRNQVQKLVIAEIAITNNGQQNQPNCSAVCVLLTAKERAQCARCDVGLRVVPCFEECHTKVNL